MNTSAICLFCAAAIKLAQAGMVAIALGRLDWIYTGFGITFAVLGLVAMTRPMQASAAALLAMAGFLVYRWSIGLILPGMPFNVICLILIALAIRFALKDELASTE